MDVVNSEEMKELLTSPVKQAEPVTNGDSTNTEHTLDSGIRIHTLTYIFDKLLMVQFLLLCPSYFVALRKSMFVFVALKKSIFVCPHSCIILYYVAFGKWICIAHVTWFKKARLNWSTGYSAVGWQVNSLIQKLFHLRLYYQYNASTTQNVSQYFGKTLVF